MELEEILEILTSLHKDGFVCINTPKDLKDWLIKDKKFKLKDTGYNDIDKINILNVFDIGFHENSIDFVFRKNNKRVVIERSPLQAYNIINNLIE